MEIAKETFSQIKTLTDNLIEVSLCDDQNPPIKEPSFPGWSTCKIVIPQNEISVALKKMKYADMYKIMSERRNYNFRLVDGALLVLQYDFSDGVLMRHTLAYYPNPDLPQFQEDAELYQEDEIYLDMIDIRNVIVPLRFDYDAREDTYVDMEHPKSHFTLGQFENCRIPVNRPLMPCQFIHFVLRNFYSHAYNKYKDRIFNSQTSFDESISENEKKIIHISV